MRKMQTLHEQNTTDIVLPSLNQTQLSEQAATQQHPHLPQATGKSSVRKGRYLFRRVEVLLLQTGGFGLIGIGLLCSLLVAVFVSFMVGASVWEYFYPNHDTQYNLPGWMIAVRVALSVLPVLLGASCCALTGRAMNKRAVRRDTLPLTHVNTADLPAVDSLVRASSEPLQAQEGVLLRAAAEGQETPPEQLVRASVGQEER